MSERFQPTGLSFLSRFDLFVFPTLGENFGHVVLESLAAGTPVIVGNDTPWHQIETVGAGWICDPASPEAVAELIERFLALDEDARMRMRTAARDLARQVLNDPRGVDANRAMFHALTLSLEPPRKWGWYTARQRERCPLNRDDGSLAEASITLVRRSTCPARFLVHDPAKTHATFDDPNLVSRAGLVPVMALAQRAGLPDLVAEHVRIARSCGVNAPVKVSCLAAGMIAGADSIDDMDLLRHGAMPALFGGVRAPSTLGSFLRAFTWGNVLHVEKVSPSRCRRSRPAGPRCCPARTRLRSWTSTRCKSASTGT